MEVISCPWESVCLWFVQFDFFFLYKERYKFFS